MKQLKNNVTMEVLGVSFNGVNDMIEHARTGVPKNGVYVGEDSMHYPCFDSEDYLYENRYYTNLVFAESRKELDEKLRQLKRMDQLKCNYNKLTVTLHPMAYWGGDSCDDVFLIDRSEEQD